jgi:hypothetical protein
VVKAATGDMVGTWYNLPSDGTAGCGSKSIIRVWRPGAPLPAWEHQA